MIVVRLAKDFTKWYTTLLHTNPYKTKMITSASISSCADILV